MASAPPHLRGFWTTDRIILTVALALLPPLAQAIYTTGFALLPTLAVALAVAIGWQVLFSRCRGRAWTPSGIITAMAVVMMLPPAASLGHIALAVSFGVVVGEQVFGGYGWNFLNPASVALAFLMFSFPNGGYEQGGSAGWAVCVPGGLLLTMTGIISWRVIVAALGGAVGVSYGAGGSWPPLHLLENSLVFGLIFLACDPVSAPATTLGRWVYGLIIGGLVAWGVSGTEGAADDIVFACLIGGLFAPLIDQGVIWLNVARRRRRNVEAA
ncbi:MAG: RnfABCDGE type electron transport complex subunit D [Planctomycetota bacterium]|nr:RnfABCDGE type electron transport complex subunit D [Planctomycetota bacterium]